MSDLNREFHQGYEVEDEPQPYGGLDYFRQQIASFT
jgi:hypothetical protein